MTLTQLEFEKLLAKTGWGVKANLDPTQKNEDGTYYYGHVQLAYDIYMLSPAGTHKPPHLLHISTSFRGEGFDLCFAPTMFQQAKLPGSQILAKEFEDRLRVLLKETPDAG